MTITKVRKIRESGSLSPGDGRILMEYQIDFEDVYSASEMLAALGGTYDGTTLPGYGTQLVGPVQNIFALDIDTDLERDSPWTDGTALLRVVFRSPQYEQQEISPLDREPDIQWRGTDDREVVFKDFDNVWVRNSAGQQYDPLPERPIEGCAECVVTFNTTTNPAAWITAYTNTVNTNAVWGAPAGKVLMGVIEAQKSVEKFQGVNFSYWRVSVPLKFNKNGWRLKIIDNGYEYIDSGKKNTVTNDDGYATARPQLLNGSGAKLAVGGTPVYYPTDGFKIIPESAWTGLITILPNPFL